MEWLLTAVLYQNEFLVQQGECFLSLCWTPYVSHVEMHGKRLSSVQSILLLLKYFSNKKIRDLSMSYFQDMDKTSLFCIANLSQLTICECFIKWWARVRFVVAKCSVFWNYISNSNQLKIKSSVTIRFSIFQFLIEPFWCIPYDK